MGRLIARAMMDACRNCDIVLLNGGGIRTSIFVDSLQDGNITFGKVLEVLPFQNTLSIMLLQGRYLIDALVHMIQIGQGRGSFIQPEGLRYIFNPNSSIPAQNRLLRAEVYNPNTQSWIPVRSSTYYRIATNDFLRSGGDGFTMLQRYAINPIDYGPAIEELFENYLAYLALLTQENVIMQEEFNKCLDASDFTEAYSHCYILISDETTQFDNLRCPTNQKWCMDHKNVQIVDGLVVDSQCAECSGLGSCQDTICTCKSPSIGPFLDVQVITGPSCSEVVPIYQPPKRFVVFSYILTSTVLVILVFVSGYYIKYRNHPVITSSSPLFLHLITFGSSLGCLWCFLLVGNYNKLSENRIIPQDLVSTNKSITQDENLGIIDTIYRDVLIECRFLEWLLLFSFLVAFGKKSLICHNKRKSCIKDK